MEIELNQALAHVLDHVEREAKEDYEKHPTDDHVYLDVCLIRGWLDSASRREGVDRTYRIAVTELDVQRATVTVRASSPEDAKERVRRGAGVLRYDGNAECPRVFLDDKVCAELRRMADHFDAFRKTLDESL